MARERDLHDHFFREAKRNGFRSRAAYKLIEIDDRRKLIPAGGRVLDCGSAPGSWLQVAAPRVGERGLVVGVDLKPIRGPWPEHVRVHEGDLADLDAALLREEGPLFDAVLSDMAPRTTGDRTIDHHGSVNLCHLVLDRCPDLLAPGGGVVVKVLEGEVYPDLLARMKRLFDDVKGFKPKASRAISTEIYAIGQGWRGADDEDRARAERRDETLAPPRPKPVAGWSIG